MEVENVLNLFDSYWYDHEFFKRSKPKIDTTEITKIPSSSNTPTTLPTIQTKKTSSSSNSSKLSEFSSSSPNSVLRSPKKLKQETAFDDYTRGKMGNITRTTKKKKRLSKSLSDLEFEEVKGFMDLGFVFSEDDDKDYSNLVSIIPGLQRLLRNNKIDDNNNNNDNNGYDNRNNDVVNDVRPPYLSEAWEVRKKKKENGVLNWKVPKYINSNCEIDMKDYLKSWAHNVASTVKL